MNLGIAPWNLFNDGQEDALMRTLYSDRKKTGVSAQEEAVVSK
jgi:hypothetical protein